MTSRQAPHVTVPDSASGGTSTTVCQTGHWITRMMRSSFPCSPRLRESYQIIFGRVQVPQRVELCVHVRKLVCRDDACGNRVE